ncbi:MAG TPA: ThuA domain-containing protein [Verrucomicrobiae bacterium]|nr:ThuA domain-containing protein [Verrucomicrobiae bacterium]
MFNPRLLATALLAVFSFTAAAAQPIRALLITGGCCHEYGKQKDVLKNGLESRINIIVDQIHTDDKSTKPPLEILGKADYAKGYDIVIHDECGSDISEPATVEAVLKPHRDGLPGVNLHCAMHSYRIGNPNEAVKELGTPHGYWFEYLGIQSSAHGPQEPIAITFTNKQNAIVRGLEDWTTVREELYNNVKVFDSATPLAGGKQIVKTRSGEERTVEHVVAWINQYGPKKTRVFSTTIGHNTATVEDARYVDLVSRGVLWATGHLKEDGAPAEGYAQQVK